MTEKTIQARIPEKLYEDLEDRIKSGIYSNRSEVIREALRKLFSEERKDVNAWKKTSDIGKKISKNWKSKKPSYKLIEESRR